LKGISVTAATTIRGSTEAIFDQIVPIDLRTVFKGYGLLPAVVDVAEQTGAWDAAAQTRKVVLSDGSSAKEELTHYDRPGQFAYRITELTGLFGLVAQEASGEWRFAESGTSTTLSWTYAFTPRSRWTRPVLGVVGLLWRRYMRRVLALCRSQIEGAG